MKASTFLIAFCLILLVSGCTDSGSEQRIAELEYRIAELQSQLESIQSKFDHVMNTFHEARFSFELLKSEVDDFSYENWRKNVPDVQDATSALEWALDDLEDAINQLQSEL